MEWLLGQELLLFALAQENNRLKHEASRRLDSDEPVHTQQESCPGRPEKMSLPDFRLAYERYWLFSFLDEENYSVEEFCEIHGISRRTYFNLKSKLK
ncbi:hypothetical protein ACNQKP_10615 [Bdellovibrio bacteriovorus]|uniref:hypothetical protein n=1 Tax=Bdellovibrio bacteriovorus TaxID=959 RepID=UPI003AA9261C